jgi:uncharacterized protein YkwD
MSAAAALHRDPTRRLTRRPLHPATACGVGLLLALTALASTSSAHAATAAPASTDQSGSCRDDSGVSWRVRATWGDVYVDSEGVRRASMDYAGWTTSRRGVVRTDSAVSTYDGSGRLLRQLPWVGDFNYRSGNAYKSRNPLNPPSAPGRATVTVTLGVSGDRFGDCTVTFVQPGAVTPTPPPPPSNSASDTYEADVITASNQERTSRGIAALAAQACVDKYAESQSQRMASESRMFHQDLGPIMDECELQAVGENVAYGYRDGAAVTAGWMASPGHRENLLNPRYRLIGVGATQDSQGRWYAAQVFGQ